MLIFYLLTEECFQIDAFRAESLSKYMHLFLKTALALLLNLEKTNVFFVIIHKKTPNVELLSSVEFRFHYVINHTVVVFAVLVTCNWLLNLSRTLCLRDVLQYL